MRKRNVLVALVVLGLLSAPRRVGADELTVFAAASLTEALTEIATGYEKASGDRVHFSFAASSVLARQIEEGAPADLFFSADEEKMDGLDKRKLLAPGTRVSLLSNTLAVVVARESSLVLRSPRDLLGSGVRSIALGEPATVPAGIYAKKYLVGLGLWERLAARVVPTESVRAALAAVEAGNADAAIVYRTDAQISRQVRVAWEVPAKEGPRISYPVAVLAHSERPAAARRLLAYLRSGPALDVFRRFGFLVVS